MKEYKKVCTICGKEFIAHNKATKMCSDACRSIREKQLGKIREEKHKKEAEKARKKKKKKKKGNPLVDMAVQARKHGMTYGQYVGYLECQKSRLERERAKRYNGSN